MSIEGWIALIGAIAVGLVSVVNAIGNHWGRKEARQAAAEASGKLEVIHKSTNSRLGKIDKKFEKATREIQRLTAENIRLVEELSRGKKS